MSDTVCEHKFVYAGVRYAHVYFREQCLERRGEPIESGDDCSYFDIRFDATPGSFEDVGVPSYDRSYGRW